MVAPAQTPLTQDLPTAAGEIETDGPIAAAMRPVIEGSFGRKIPIRFEFWDGSTLNPPDQTVATLKFTVARRHPATVVDAERAGSRPGVRRRARSISTATCSMSSPRSAMRSPRSPSVGRAWKVLPTAVTAAKRVGALGRPLAPPPEEARLHGWRHSLKRDATAIGHHYDVGNDFYRLVLGPTMTYSCARFAQSDFTLEDAQTAKHDLDLSQARACTSTPARACSTSVADGARW